MPNGYFSMVRVGLFTALCYFITCCCSILFRVYVSFDVLSVIVVGVVLLALAFVALLIPSVPLFF